MIIIGAFLRYSFVACGILIASLATPVFSAMTLSDDELDTVSAAGEIVPTPSQLPPLRNLSDAELEAVDGEGLSIPYIGLPLEAAHRMSGLALCNQDTGKGLMLPVGGNASVISQGNTGMKTRASPITGINH